MAAETKEAFENDLFAPFFIENTAEEKRMHYDKVAHVYDEHLSCVIGCQVCLNYILPCLPSSGNLRIMDAGCGTGILGPYLRQQPRASDIHLIGLDYSAGMLAEAEKKNTFDELLQRDFNAPFEIPGGPVDGMIAAAVFLDGHVGPEVIMNLAPHVRTGGIFAISVRQKTFERIGDEYRKIIKDSKFKILKEEKAEYNAPGSPFAYYLVLEKEE